MRKEKPGEFPRAFLFSAPDFHPGNPPRHRECMSGTATAPARYYMLRDVNLFASGVYRGRRWLPRWVRNMAEAGKLLGPSGLKLHTPPSAPGHEDDEGWREFVPTDEPAAGWVDPDSLRAVPDPKHEGHVILRGNVVNIPEPMARKIASGEYRYGSSEIYDSFLDDFGRKYGKVLRKFSFLGSEVPQVKRLGPLPKPEPMPAPKVFSERPGVRIRERIVRGRSGALITFAETIPMDRQSMLAAAKAAMPGLSQATLDALSDDQLADLLKNLPAQAAPPGAGAAPPAMPVGGGSMFADDEEDPAEGTDTEPSREEMIAALVDAGEDPDELDGMSDEELGALYDEEMAGAQASGAGGSDDVATMGDPATMTREEMIAELTAQGQDAAQLQGMTDDDLRALYAQLTGGAAPAAPAAPAATPMSDTRRRKPKPNRRGTTVLSETRKVVRNARQLNNYIEHELRRLRVQNEQQKRQDAETFCDRLVTEGRATPAMVKAAILPSLLGLDNTRPVHRFTENGRTGSRTAYEVRKAELAKLPVTVRFGERFPAGSPEAKDQAAAEVRKVERFCELQGEQLRKHGSDPKKMLDTAKKRAEANPNFRAADLIGADAAAMVS